MSNSSTKTERANLIPTPGARNVTKTKRGPGRASKNPVAQPAPVAEPMLKMVEQYRDIQKKIKDLNEELAPIKDALTRHLVAGDEDKIELPDGSYVITKVMKAQWTYSEKLQARQLKFKEQKLDLENAEKKERLNGTASAIYNAHVMGKAK